MRTHPLYADIAWPEMEEFFRARSGYVRHVPLDWNELAFIRMFPRQNLAVVVGTGFDRTRRMRPAPNDSMRVMLGQTLPLRLPAMRLKSTARTFVWRTKLNRRIDLMEELIQAAPRCPLCGNHMIPHARRDRFGAFWSCRFYDLIGCCGRKSMRLTLAERLLRDSPEPRGRLY